MCEEIYINYSKLEKKNKALRKENKELKILVAKLEKLVQELEKRDPVDPWEPCFRLFGEL